ncbi:MAG: oligosaccharide flippase family protein [Bacteroidales bacterium]|nr:oligosaccharide flippase family protein [Bacteroidales bacterium]
MGLIEKQTIKGTVYTYIGAALGFINISLLFPKILLANQIGLLSILVAYSMLLSQFGNLGFTSATVRLFSYFRNKKKNHNGFLFLSICVSLVGFFITLIIFLVIKPSLIKNSVDNSQLLGNFIYYVIPLTFFTLFFNSLDVYYRALYNAIIGVFLKEFLSRVLIFISVFLFFLNLIDFEQFVFCYILSLSLPTLIIIVSLIKEGNFNLRPQLNFLTKDLTKSLASVSLFGILGGFAGIIIVNIDRIMIERMLGLSSTGIYTIAFYFGTLIILPFRSLIKISSAVIADAWKDNNKKIIYTIYYKSAINQLVIGIFIFIGIWANIHNIFKILPAPYESGRYVIFFISLAYLFDMSTGAAVSIVANSKYYRYQTLFLLLLVVLVVISNFILIPKFGIVGAALASALSKFIYNLIRYLFIYFKFQFQPYNIKFLYILLIGAVSYFAGYIIPEFSNYVIDIFIRSIAISIIFISLILILKISEEANKKFKEIIRLF